MRRPKLYEQPVSLMFVSLRSAPSKLIRHPWFVHLKTLFFLDLNSCFANVADLIFFGTFSFKSPDGKDEFPEGNSIAAGAGGTEWITKRP